MSPGSNNGGVSETAPRFPLGEALRRAGDRSRVRVRGTELQIRRVVGGARNDVIAAISSAVADGWEPSRVSHKLHTTTAAFIARSWGAAGAAVLELVEDAVVADTRAHEADAAHEVRRVIPWLNISATDGGEQEAMRIRRRVAMDGHVRTKSAETLLDMLARLQSAVWKAQNAVDFLKLSEVIVEDIERRTVKGHVLTLAAAVGQLHRTTIAEILGAYAEGGRRIAVDQGRH